MDVIAGQPDCAGQAADAVSAFSQAKLEDAPRLLKVPKSEWPDEWVRFPRHKCPKSWANIQDPVVPLERNLCAHPLAGLWWERQFEEVLRGLGWEKIRTGNVSLFIENNDYSCRHTWMTSKWLGRERHFNPVWKKLMKLGDLGEPSLPLDHVFLRRTREMGAPKACLEQAAADPRGSRTCVCASTLRGCGTRRGEKGKLTSCRGTDKSAWQVPPVRRKVRRPGCPQGVRGCQSSLFPECVRVTGRAGENGQYSGNRAAARPGQDRRLHGVVTRPRPQRAPARSRVGTTKCGSGSPGGRTLSKEGDGSMYSQAHVRTWEGEEGGGGRRREGRRQEGEVREG